METKRIISQIEKFHENNWAEVNVDEIFSGIDDEMANKKMPLYNNTIHQIARHILATEFVVIKRLQGINYQLKKEEDWIPLDELKKIQWTNTRDAFIESRKEIIFELNKKDDSAIYEPIIENYPTIYDTIHGHLQHSYYHIGQISIIKKLIEKFYET